MTMSRVLATMCRGRIGRCPPAVAIVGQRIVVPRVPSLQRQTEPMGWGLFSEQMPRAVEQREP